VNRDRILSGSSIVLLIAAVKLLFHLFTAGRYGIFRDELYYLLDIESAMKERLVEMDFAAKN